MNDTLGKRIQALRKRKGISQEELADLLNISRQSVQKWETDHSSPEIAKLAKLGEILDVSLDYLIKGEDDISEIIGEGDIQVEPSKVEVPQPVTAKTVNRNILYSFKYQSGGILITPSNKKIDASFKIKGGVLYSRRSGFNWPFAILGCVASPLGGILLGTLIPHKWNSQLSLSSIKGIQICSNTIVFNTNEGIYKFSPGDFPVWEQFFSDFSYLLDPRLAKENELKLKKEQEREDARIAAVVAEEARKEAERKRQLELKRIELAAKAEEARKNEEIQKRVNKMRGIRINQVLDLIVKFEAEKYIPSDKKSFKREANLALDKIKLSNTEEDADKYVKQLNEYANKFSVNPEYYGKLKKKKIIISISVLSGIIALSMSALGVCHGIKSYSLEQKYNSSLELLCSGEYKEASNLFSTISGYKDSDSKIIVSDMLFYLYRNSESSASDIKQAIYKIIRAGETVKLIYNEKDPTNPFIETKTYSEEFNEKNMFYSFRKSTSYPGYKFYGWGLSNLAYKDGIASLTFNSNYDCISYTIDYHLDGGVNNESNPSQYTIEDTIVLQNPTKPGYSFIGWYDKKGNKVTGIEKGSVGSYSFYAHWSANSYKLSVDSSNSNGGTVEGSETYKCDEIVTISAMANIGYEFEGWYSGATKLSPFLTFTFNMPAYDYFLIAKFAGKPYQLTLINEDTNMGSVSGDGTYAYESSVTVTATPKHGYSFGGWYNNSEKLSSSSYTFIMPSNDFSLTARFFCEQLYSYSNKRR